jgi:hypothetical protein
VPTIGIGAGIDVSGQVLVNYDMLDIYPGRKARFVKNFMQGAPSVRAAIEAYVKGGEGKDLPGPRALVLMDVIRTVEELRKRLAAERSVAVVPTMGNLHAGHVSLVDEAHKHAKCVVATIFVNRLQFAVGGDFDRYPRTLAQDRWVLENAGCNVAFAPDEHEMYPQPQTIHVTPPEIARPLEGEFRPGHFQGVCTVVAKLFNIVKPQVAIFGKKDFQQLAVIRAMERQLDFGIEIVGAETVSRSRRARDVVAQRLSQQGRARHGPAAQYGAAKGEGGGGGRIAPLRPPRRDGARRARDRRLERRLRRGAQSRHAGTPGPARQGARGGGGGVARQDAPHRQPGNHRHRVKKQLPLEGIRVIEFSHMVMGPTTGLVLADLGAEVIKVEPEGKGDPTRYLKSTGADSSPRSAATRRA